MKTKTVLLFMMAAISLSIQASPKGITVKEVKYIALKTCLVSHYRERTPPDIFSPVNHDASFMVETYALDHAKDWKPLIKFVAKETKNFDKLTLPLHPDSAEKANNILEQCVKFYESDKLEKFAQDLFKQ